MNAGYPPLHGSIAGECLKKKATGLVVMVVTDFCSVPRASLHSTNPLLLLAIRPFPSVCLCLYPQTAMRLFLAFDLLRCTHCTPQYPTHGQRGSGHTLPCQLLRTLRRYPPAQSCKSEIGYGRASVPLLHVVKSWPSGASRYSVSPK